MSETMTLPEDPILEDARRRLLVIIDSSSARDAGLYLQQVAQAGLQALDTLPSCSEAQQLAETIAQQVDDLYSPLQNIADLDEGLESDLLGLLGAIIQIQEIQNVSDGTVGERLTAFEENIQELSARIAWLIVSSGNSEQGIMPEEEVGCPSSPAKLTSQTTDGTSSFTSNLLDPTNSTFGDTTPDDNASDPLSRSTTPGSDIAFLLQTLQLSGTTAADTTPTDRVPDSSAMPVDSASIVHHHSQTLGVEETYQLGVDLMNNFRNEGDLRSLSNSISRFRESLLLCPSSSPLRLEICVNFAGALLMQYEQEGEYSDLTEALARLHEMLTLCPPGHPYRTTILNNLAIAFMARYEREDNLLDLSDVIRRYQEALELCPPGHLHRAMILHSLSNAIMTRYQRGGCLSDLSDAIEQRKEALELHPPGHPDRALSLNNLSSALSTRYERQGILLDLSESIEHYEEALELCPPGHPKRDSSLNNLSDALMTRYGREGGLLDLLKAIECYREELELNPPGHPDRAACLNNLSSALLTRYKREGSLSDLLEAIEHYREALQLRPPGHSGRAGSLNNLSNALLTLYEWEGSLLHLSEATQLSREALELCPHGHLGRASGLTSLSNALMTWYKREGSLSDLSGATGLYREALELCPPGHPDRAGNLNNLSTALLTQYEQEGSLSDLSEAVECYREALELHPPGHPDRVMTLNNLSGAITERYKREGSLSDLSDATEQRQKALELCPPGHPDRGMSLHNLSNAIMERYQREGSLSDLSDVTEQRREALELCPRGNPERASSLIVLSNALLTRYEREGSLSDLSEATEHCHEALELCPPGHQHRAMILNSLSHVIMVRYDRERSLSDLLKATEYQQEALKLHPPGHPYRAGALNNLSITLLTRYEREGSLLDLSEAIERYREALELFPPGDSDRASCLANLSNAIKTRYEREGSLSDLSEATQQCRQALKLRPHGHPNRTQSLCALSRVFLLAILRVNDGHDMHSDQTLVQKVFESLREAVALPDCPPLHRLQAALQWIDTARQLASSSMLDAYHAALSQLDIVLAMGDTLEGKHTQLISSELSRCRKLGVDAASYALRQGHMALAVELLERGRNLLFGQIGRYRVDLRDLEKENPEFAEKFSNLSRLLDASVVSNQPTLEGRTAFEDPIERYRRVSSAWNRTVADIRGLEGFEHFLRASIYTELRAAAAEGPVVIVIPGDGQSDALIVCKEHDAPHHINLPNAGRAELGELGITLLEAIHSNDEPSTEKSVKKVLCSLWDFVVGPIADKMENELHIPQHSRIWWCPTSIFSFLPLHVAGRYTSKGKNLPDRYVSSYTPTLRALLRSRRNRCTSKGVKLLIVAQPDTPGQSPLPNAQPEAELVKKLAGGKMQTTILSGKGGTHAAVLDGMASHSWLHFICHGSQNPFGNPFDSCFCLYDQKLSLQDIMRRGLPDAEFAFLAACHTATGDVELADEGLHLAAGLQFAGFKSVVGTIWEVADSDGPVIAEAFYEALRLDRPEEEGMDCSRAAYALSKAVKKLRDSGVPISCWMRFIHIGI